MMNLTTPPFKVRRHLPVELFRTVSCVVAAVCTVTLLCNQSVADEPVQLIGIGQFSGTATDLSGQADQLENGEPHNRLGGFSALEYTGTGNRYVALPDRGPDDGATGYLCRFQHVEVNIQPEATPSVTVNLIESTLLTDNHGRPFTGASTAMVPVADVGERLDPEGFRFGNDGGFFVSDEYGPQLIEFSADGQEQHRLTLPEHLMATILADSKAAENFANVKGRSSNKGMEGLAISADGKTLYGIMQHVLLQDGERQPNGRSVGKNCRIVQVDIATGAVREFVYQLEDTRNGLNEILAIGNDEFLVIERDGDSGADAAFKKVMKISLAGATPVQRMRQLPSGELPESIRPVSKEVFIDFLDPRFQLTTEQLPEKLEGLTGGPKLADGRRTILVASDNDFEAESPSLIYVFAVPNRSTVAVK